MDIVFTTMSEVIWIDQHWMKYHCQYIEGHKAEGLFTCIDHLYKCLYYGLLRVYHTVKATIILVQEVRWGSVV